MPPLVFLIASLVLRSAGAPTAAVSAQATSPRVDVDTTAVCAAVLHAVRDRYADRDVVLAGTVCDASTCDRPTFRAGRRVVHAAARIDSLRSAGPVRATCRLSGQMMGCRPLRTTDILVGLGPVMNDVFGLPPNLRDRAQQWPQHDGDVWVAASMIAPCAEPCRHSDAWAGRFLLRRSVEGRWDVLGVAPLWIH